MQGPDAALRTDHLLADLGRRSARGGVVTITAQAGKVLLQFATVAALARLLPPTAFGLIAMVAALNAVFDLIKEFGISAATIRKPDLTHDEVSALFWINAAAGILIALTLVALAPAIASFYGEPTLKGITRYLAIGFVLSGLSVQHWALLRRQMRFSIVAAVDVGSEAAGFAVALSLAIMHAGYWALVAQRLAVPALALAGSWLFCPWRPGPPRRCRGLGPLLRYGASVTCVNIAAALTRSLDQVVVGWLWGAVTLGLYERSAKLLLTPTLSFVVSLYSIAMPVMSRLDSDPARYRRAFRDIIAMLAMVAMPGAALVASTSDWVVAIMFGVQWRETAPFVACFAIAAAYQPVAQLLGVLYLSQDRKREMLRAALIDTGLFMAAIGAGVWFGALGIAVALAAVGWTLRLPVAVWLATRRGPVRIGDMAAAIAPAAATALTTAGAIGALRLFVMTAGVGPVLGLVIAVAVAGAISVAVLTFMPHSRRILMRLMQHPRTMRGGDSAIPI